MRTTVNVNFGGTRDAFSEGDHPREGGKFATKGEKAATRRGKEVAGHKVTWEAGTKGSGGKVSGHGGNKHGHIHVGDKPVPIIKHSWGQYSVRGNTPYGVPAKEVGTHSDLESLVHAVKKHVTE